MAEMREPTMAEQAAALSWVHHHIGPPAGPIMSDDPGEQVAGRDWVTEAADEYRHALAVLVWENDRPEVVAEREQVERHRVELRDAHNDLLNVRGMLSPNGHPCRVPDDVMIVPNVAPAIRWLLDEIDRLKAESVEFRTEYAVWCHGEDPDGIRHSKDAFGTVEFAEDWASQQYGRYGITGHRLMRREHHRYPEGSRFEVSTTPWVLVETAAVTR